MLFLEYSTKKDTNASKKMFVSIDVIFVEEDYAYYLRGYLDASLKGGEKSWDVLPLPSTSISSSETIAPTSRAFL